jgi:hypothetical protein
MKASISLRVAGKNRDTTSTEIRADLTIDTYVAGATDTSTRRR